MMPPSRTLTCSLLITLLPLGAAPLAAQDQGTSVDRPAEVKAARKAEPDEFEQAQQDEAEFLERVQNQVLEEFRTAAQAKLLLEIEELSNVCELDAKSVKKLEIAAKGAADRWVRNEEQQLRSRVNLERYGADAEIRVGGKKIPRPGEAEEEPQPEAEQLEKKTAEKQPVFAAIAQFLGAAPARGNRVEEQNIVNISVSIQRYGLQYRVKHRNGSSSSGFGGGLEELKREGVWARTMQEVITPAQQKKYDASIEERSQRLREGAIIYSLGVLDITLRLTTQQREQLREVFNTSVNIGTINPSSVRYTVERQIKDTDVELLKPILSDAQLRVWQEYAEW